MKNPALGQTWPLSECVRLPETASAAIGTLTAVFRTERTASSGANPRTTAMRVCFSRAPRPS